MALNLQLHITPTLKVVIVLRIRHFTKHSGNWGCRPSLCAPTSEVLIPPLIACSRHDDDDNDGDDDDEDGDNEDDE